ncbi:hypothetical protein RSAG8_06690, partial [Rhizoctonia solani AG-8 WAC10335]
MKIGPGTAEIAKSDKGRGWIRMQHRGPILQSLVLAHILNSFIIERKYLPSS